MHHGYEVFTSRDQPVIVGMPSFKAVLTAYSGPGGNVQPINLRIGKSRRSRLEAMSNMLESMEIEMGVRLRESVLGGVIGAHGSDVNLGQYRLAGEPFVPNSNAYVSPGGRLRREEYPPTSPRETENYNYAYRPPTAALNARQSASCAGPNGGPRPLPLPLTDARLAREQRADASAQEPGGENSRKA